MTLIAAISFFEWAVAFAFGALTACVVIVIVVNRELARAIQDEEKEAE